MADASSNTSAYLVGEPHLEVEAYIKGALSGLSTKTAYMAGSQTSSDNTPAYLTGNIAASDTIAAYLTGTSTSSRSVKAFIQGLERSSISAYLEGATVANTYITLTTSNASLSKRFRVLAGGYDDGTLDKAQSGRRTLGGGIDRSMGAVYRSWSPKIRVFHTESDSNYGDIADLEYFYSLTNPNGTPSNVIDFTDHHGITYEVHIVGQFKKSLLGTQIEGTESSSIVALRLERITGE